MKVGVQNFRKFSVYILRLSSHQSKIVPISPKQALWCISIYFFIFTIIFCFDYLGPSPVSLKQEFSKKSLITLTGSQFPQQYKISCLDKFHIEVATSRTFQARPSYKLSSLEPARLFYIHGATSIIKKSIITSLTWPTHF